VVEEEEEVAVVVEEDAEDVEAMLTISMVHRRSLLSRVKIVGCLSKIQVLSL
jgi:hypothetical protein